MTGHLISRHPHPDVPPAARGHELLQHRLAAAADLLRRLPELADSPGQCLQTQSLLPPARLQRGTVFHGIADEEDIFPLRPEIELEDKWKCVPAPGLLWGQCLRHRHPRSNQDLPAAELVPAENHRLWGIQHRYTLSLIPPRQGDIVPPHQDKIRLPGRSARRSLSRRSVVEQHLDRHPVAGGRLPEPAESIVPPGSRRGVYKQTSFFHDAKIWKIIAKFGE